MASDRRFGPREIDHLEKARLCLVAAHEAAGLPVPEHLAGAAREDAPQPTVSQSQQDPHSVTSLEDYRATRGSSGQRGESAAPGAADVVDLFDEQEMFILPCRRVASEMREIGAKLKALQDAPLPTPADDQTISDSRKPPKKRLASGRGPRNAKRKQPIKAND